MIWHLPKRRICFEMMIFRTSLVAQTDCVWCCQSVYLNPNHHIFLNLTSWFCCLNLTKLQLKNEKTFFFLNKQTKKTEGFTWHVWPQSLGWKSCVPTQPQQPTCFAAIVALYATWPDFLKAFCQKAHTFLAKIPKTNFSQYRILSVLTNPTRHLL